MEIGYNRSRSVKEGQVEGVFKWNKADAANSSAIVD